MTNNEEINVYTIFNSDRSECLQTLRRDEFELLTFDGRPRAASWKPVAIRRIRDFGDGLPVVPVDFPLD